jgi:hypothetical protein
MKVAPTSASCLRATTRCYELFAFSDSTTQPRYNCLVATTAGTARLPDTSALGVPFPAGLTLQWLARSQRGYASLDDYAAASEATTGTGFSGVQALSAVKPPGS